MKRGSAMEEEPFSVRLKRLEDRLAAANAPKKESASQGAQKYTQSSLAWRMVIELVAGMGLGLAIGFGLDAVFGTRPLMLVIFVLLGFAAGVRTMMRTASEVREGRAEGARLRPTPEPDDPAPRSPVARGAPPASEQLSGEPPKGPRQD